MQTHNGKLARASFRRATRPAGTPPAEEGIASSGIAFQLWRLYQHAWLVCLIFPLASLVRNPLPAKWESNSRTPSSLVWNHHARRGEGPCVPKLGKLPVEQQIAFIRHLRIVAQQGHRRLARSLG